MGRKATALRRPNVGDRVTVADPFEIDPKVAWTEGVVVDLLSSQFTVRVGNGTIRFAFYRHYMSAWRYSK